MLTLPPQKGRFVHKHVSKPTPQVLGNNCAVERSLDWESKDLGSKAGLPLAVRHGTATSCLWANDTACKY